MNEVEAFDAYHKTFAPPDSRPGTEFIVRYLTARGARESAPFADRKDALALMGQLRDSLGWACGAVVIAREVGKWA